MLKENVNFKVIKSEKLNGNKFESLVTISKDIAYESFLELKKGYIKNLNDQYEKYLYAINLKIESANKIGIENIKRARVKLLLEEKKENLDKFNVNKDIIPVLKPIFISYLER